MSNEIASHVEISDPSGAPPAGDDPPIEALRSILFDPYRERIAALEQELEDVGQRITGKDALVATISPIMGDAIRRQIRDSREEMIEALYPIIGQLVVRAVTEAVRDLARAVDAQVRRSLDLRSLWWRIRARLGGVSSAEASLRAALPFEVREIFFVHRETGLLLWHISRDPDARQDSDLVGSMLTAIRDFVQDAFGRGREGQLEEIEYGEQRILIEASRHAYLAVVVDGVEPPGFRAEMRERIIQLEHRFGDLLSQYEGDSSLLASAGETLLPLLTRAGYPELESQ